MPHKLTVEEIKERMGDRKWRLNNLYYIKDSDGNKVQFEMRAVQEHIHDNFWFYTIIPKARQLGMTTFFTIFYLDQILFSKNKTAVIIAHREQDMKKIFRDKIKFAWDNLHPWLREYIGEPINNSAFELVFPSGSSIATSMSARSGTVQYLHVSEFGYICNHAPEKAEEIVSGAFNAVHAGNVVSIESTASPGQEGRFYEYCMKAQKMQKEGRQLTEMDFKLFFFPWYIEPNYSLPEATFLITKEYNEYFKSLQEKHGIKLSMGQKRWYQKKAELMGSKMHSEYPSTLEEAFMTSVEGAYYTNEMNRVYSQRRILRIPHDPMYPVDTWWDLGMNDRNVILFLQRVGPQIRFLDIYINSGEGLAHYKKICDEKAERNGWRYGEHVFPHDIEVKELGTGISRKQVLWDLGFRNIRVAPKIGLLDGIERVRGIFSKFYFDEENCEKLHQSLAAYKKKKNKEGGFSNMPVHNKDSHTADAVRTGAVCYREDIPMTEYERELVAEGMDTYQHTSFFS